jgi:hypothetical protein
MWPCIELGKGLRPIANDRCTLPFQKVERPHAGKAQEEDRAGLMEALTEQRQPVAQPDAN